MRLNAPLRQWRGFFFCSVSNPHIPPITWPCSPITHPTLESHIRTPSLQALQTHLLLHFYPLLKKYTTSYLTLDTSHILWYITCVNNEKINVRGIAIEAWIDSIPEDPYQPCPCGCNQKWRFVIKQGETELAKHEEAFVQTFIKGMTTWTWQKKMESEPLRTTSTLASSIKSFNAQSVNDGSTAKASSLMRRVVNTSASIAASTRKTPTNRKPERKSHENHYYLRRSHLSLPRPSRRSYECSP